jgi:bacterioferritin
MKGNSQIIERLNARLSEELAAISQYIVHAEVCDNWGYGKLHDADQKRAIDEMGHAEKLIARILFLEGRPIVSNLAAIHIGADVETQHKNDLAGELGAVAAYNADIAFAVETGDNGTREMIESILKDEEMHVDWIEAQLDQINQVGIQNYLAQQLA